MARLRLRVADMLGVERLCGSVEAVARVEVEIRGPGTSSMVRLLDAGGALLSAALLSARDGVQFERGPWDERPASADVVSALTVVITVPGSTGEQVRAHLSDVDEVEIQLPFGAADQWEIVVTAGRDHTQAHTVQSRFSISPPWMPASTQQRAPQYPERRPDVFRGA